MATARARPRLGFNVVRSGTEGGGVTANGDSRPEEHATGGGPSARGQNASGQGRGRGRGRATRGRVRGRPGQAHLGVDASREGSRGISRERDRSDGRSRGRGRGRGRGGRGRGRGGAVSGGEALVDPETTGNENEGDAQQLGSASQAARLQVSVANGEVLPDVSSVPVAPGSKRRVRWNALQDDALLRLVEHLGTNWPSVKLAWEKAELDQDAGPDAPERSAAAMRQRYYLLMGRRPGKKAPPRRKHMDRWEVQDDLDLLEAIEKGGEGFGVDGTVDSACAAISKTLNSRPHCPIRTEMSVYNRVRRLCIRKNMTIYDFLGIPDLKARADADAVHKAAAQAGAAVVSDGAVAVAAAMDAVDRTGGDVAGDGTTAGTNDLIGPSAEAATERGDGAEPAP